MRNMIIALAVSASAFAATPAAAETANWAGPYVGAVVGVTNTHSNVNDNDSEISSWGNSGALNGQRTSVTGGLTGGYNFQSGPFVYGVEGDVSLTDANTKANGYSVNTYVHTRQHWSATARARAGIAIGNVLPYFTAGLSIGETRHEVYDYGAQDGYTGCGASGSDTGWVCQTKTGVGYAVGGGVEGKVSKHVSVKAEYLHTTLPTATAYLYSYSPIHFSDSYDTFRVGVNYHF